MDRLTLLDIARQSDPQGAAARIAKVLTQVNPILQEIPWLPSNAPLGNRVTVEVSLPSVAWGKINKGISHSKFSNNGFSHSYDCNVSGKNQDQEKNSATDSFMGDLV